MPDHSRRHHHAGRADLVPVLAVVILGAILLGVATLWDTSAPDVAVDPRTAAGAVSISSGTDTGTDRARHDEEPAATEGQVLPGLAQEAEPPAPAAGVADDEGVAQLKKNAERIVTKVNQRSATFKIGTFNVLAVKHTEPGGQHASWPGAGWRAGQTVGLIKRHGVQVVGLQEVKSSQLAAITSGTGFDAWPAGGDPDNSVIWNPAVFELVEGEQFWIYFMTRNRPQTVVRLRHKESKREFYVVNMHTSAGHGGKYASTRNAAFGTAVSYVKKLQAEKIPIFMTGDMNDRGNFYCRVVAQVPGMVAAQGGGGTCGSAPRMRPVDWITGVGRVDFSGYVDDFSSEGMKVSDHPFVSATATMRGSED